MKRLNRTLALLLLLGLLLPTVCARAEEESAAERGLKAVMSAVNGKGIVLPKEESWLSEWKTLYARKAWYAPSLYVESVPFMGSGVPAQPSLFEGTQATVVAEENDMSCILYRNVDYQLCAGWILSIRLLDEFPGEFLSIGEEREGDFEILPEAEQRWSGAYLPSTQQPYTVFTEPVENCVGFTFEYQMTAENTPLKDIVMGLRTLWVSDGENWTAVGCFPYYETGAVRVQVWLPEPMKIAALGTVAQCHAPNKFDFRQTARDFLLQPAA